MTKDRIIELIEGEIKRKKAIIKLLDERGNELGGIHSEVAEALETVLSAYKEQDKKWGD